MSKAYSEKIYNKEKLLLLVESGKTIIISNGVKFDIDTIIFKTRRTGAVEDAIKITINSNKTITFFIVHAKILLSCIFDNTYYLDTMRIELDSNETLALVFDPLKYDVFLSGVKYTVI
jgi:hypothetical protein